jgi:hypothetical protein
MDEGTGRACHRSGQGGGGDGVDEILSDRLDHRTSELGLVEGIAVPSDE